MRSPARLVRVVASLAVTAFFGWLLLRSVDVTAVGAALGQVGGFTVLIGIACIACGYTLRIIRWWLMLRAVAPGVHFSACTRPFLVSTALNNLLPLRAGDAVRVMGFRRQLDAPGMRVLGTLVIERLLDVMVLLALFFIGVQFIPADAVPPAFVTAAAVAVGMASLGLVALVAGFPLIKRAAERTLSTALARESALGPALARHVRHLLELLDSLRSPGLTAQLLLLSVAVWAFEGGVFVAAARGLGLAVHPGGPWFALSTGTLATVLPSSPGYVGTFDYFVVLGLTAYGAGSVEAAGFAVLVHGLLWLPLTVAGLVFLIAPGARTQTSSSPGASLPEAR